MAAIRISSAVALEIAAAVVATTPTWPAWTRKTRSRGRSLSRKRSTGPAAGPT